MAEAAQVYLRENKTQQTVRRMCIIMVYLFVRSNQSAVLMFWIQKSDKSYFKNLKQLSQEQSKEC